MQDTNARPTLPNILDDDFVPPTRVRTDLQAFDALFVDRTSDNRGVPPGSVIVLTGRPGLGKTTLVLQILDGFTRNGCFTVLATNEQDKNTLVGTAQAIGLSRGINVILDDQRSSAELLARVDMTADFHAVPRVVLAIDSLQGLDLDQRNSTKTAWDNIERWTRRNGAIVLLINHLRKDNIIAGSAKIVQRCDTVIELDRPGGGEPGELLLRVDKNRHGLAGVRVRPLWISKTGIDADSADIIESAAQGEVIVLDEEPGSARAERQLARMQAVAAIVAARGPRMGIGEIHSTLASEYPALAANWTPNGLSQAVSKAIRKGTLSLLRTGTGAGTRYSARPSVGDG